MYLKDKFKSIELFITAVYSQGVILKIVVPVTCHMFAPNRVSHENSVKSLEFGTYVIFETL